MRSKLDNRLLVAGLTVVVLAGACMPPGIGTAVGGACAACSVFDLKSAAPASAKTATASTRAVDALALASDLASYGYRTNSPLSLLTAAELLIEASPTPLAGKQGSSNMNVASKSGTSVRFEPGALITSALSMGSGDASVSALATQLRNQLSRPKGAAGGPSSTTDRVLAYATDTWTINFRGNERGSIRVRGDGDTDLDCYVYNSSGTLVAIDNDYTDYCILDWYHNYSGPIRLEIRNLGGVYNQYVLSTN